MQARELTVPGVIEFTPITRGDDRGAFLEWYRHDLLEQAVGHSLDLRQANASVSRRGVVRGIHFADIPPGQAKYVTVPHGAIIDFAIDIRVGSDTFGAWDSTRLDSTDRRALYLPEGIGHCFVALEDDTTVTYLVSDTYNASREHGINPLDPAIGLEFPFPVDELLLSPKDLQAPSLDEAKNSGLLPTRAEADAYQALLNEGRR